MGSIKEQIEELEKDAPQLEAQYDAENSKVHLSYIITPFTDHHVPSFDSSFKERRRIIYLSWMSWEAVESAMYTLSQLLVNLNSSLASGRPNGELQGAVLVF